MTKFNIRNGTNDIGILREVFNSKEYSFDYVQNKKDIKTIVDIGAHIGGFTVKALETFQNANCISYEPMKDNFNLLHENTKRFGERIKINNLSVSGDRVPRDLQCSNLKFENGNVNTGSNIFNYSIGATAENNIHIKDIQKEIKEIDILKLDCEGGENSIFENLDFNSIKYIYCELHIYGSLIGNKETLNMIIEKGFDIYYHKYVNDKIENFIAIKKGVI